jgi:hypothetical protein
MICEARSEQQLKLSKIFPYQLFPTHIRTSAWIIIKFSAFSKQNIQRTQHVSRFEVEAEVEANFILLSRPLQNLTSVSIMNSEDSCGDLLHVLYSDRICLGGSSKLILGGGRHRMLVSTSQASLSLFSTRGRLSVEKRWNFPSEPISACHDILVGGEEDFIVLTEDGCVWSCTEQPQSRNKKKSKAKQDDPSQRFAILGDRRMPQSCEVGQISFICRTRMQGARHIFSEQCGRLIVVGELTLGDAFVYFITRPCADDEPPVLVSRTISIGRDAPSCFAFASCSPPTGPTRAAPPEWPGLAGAPHALLAPDLFAAMFGPACSTQGPVLLISCRLPQLPRAARAISRVTFPLSRVILPDPVPLSQPDKK